MPAPEQELAHSELGPSGASRWMNCPGSVTLSKGKPNTSSDASNEGTAAHAVAEMCLRDDLDPVSYIGAVIEGWTITKAMVPFISEYVEYVRGESAFASYMGIEQRFTIISEFGIFGTTDAVLVQGDTLHVIDLKFGIGVSVDAYKNKQGMLYAIGALDSLSKKDRKGISKIRITIHQPRKDNISSWELSLADLELFRHEVIEAAKKASSGSMECNIGEWCRWCKGIVECPSQNAEAISMAQTTFEPESIGLSELSRVFLIKDAVKKYLEAVESHLLGLALSGENVPGLKLVSGRRGPLSWNDKDMASEFLESMIGDEVFKPRDLKTPTECSKISPELKADIEALASRSEPKLKLVSEADKGKAVIVNPNEEAQRVFEAS